MDAQARAAAEHAQFKRALVDRGVLALFSYNGFITFCSLFIITWCIGALVYALVLSVQWCGETMVGRGCRRVFCLDVFGRFGKRVVGACWRFGKRIVGACWSFAKRGVKACGRGARRCVKACAACSLRRLKAFAERLERKKAVI